MRIVPHSCAVYGIDLGKTTFHIAGADQHGRPTLRIKLRRDPLLQFFATRLLRVWAWKPVREHIGWQGN